VTVEIDNTGNDAVMLSSAMLNITVDNSQFEIVSGDDTVTFDEIGKEIITKKYTFKAVPQTDLTAGGGKEKKTKHTITSRIARCAGMSR